MRKMRKMRNWAQLIFVARKMRKFAPTRKPVALETLVLVENVKIWYTEHKWRPVRKRRRYVMLVTNSIFSFFNVVGSILSNRLLATHSDAIRFL